jgi:hypothetical protein
MTFSFAADDDFGNSYDMDEEFGLAKNFTNAPLGSMFPGNVDENKNVAQDADRECEGAFHNNIVNNEIKADGFCFKLAPVENQA